MEYEVIEARAKEMGLPVWQYMRVAAQRVQRLTAELNFTYHESEEVVRLFSELIGKPVGEGFCLFPPFYTDYGQNITIGKGGVPQHQLSLSGPGGYHHRGRHPHRPQRGAGHSQPQRGPGAPERCHPRPHRHRK